MAHPVLYPADLALPVVALVGRPNVGKSTLFNRMVGARRALVDNRPGVTRDRLFGECEHAGRIFRVVDTGGFDDDKDDPLLQQMLSQTQLAIDEADAAILVVDGAGGVTPDDREVAVRLRRAGLKVITAVNKVDVVGHEERGVDFYELGFDLVTVSAEHGRHFGELLDRVLEDVDAPQLPDADDEARALEEAAQAQEEEGAESKILWQGGPIRVAVIGRPNVGKSSLINRLLGKERLVSSDIAGTTRDSIDTVVERDDQSFVFIDTAGIRRKRSIADKLEKFSVMSALRTVDRADVVVLVLDAAERPSDQDAKVAAIAHERGKGILIVGNKWDMIENPEWRDGYPAAVRMDLSFVDYAEFVRVSAKTGRGTQKIFPAIVAAQRERHRRIGTAALNRFLGELLGRQPLTYFKGKRAQIFFASQPMVRPPTFVFASRNPENISQAYRRYLHNQLRERFGFVGTPLWLKFRAKKR